MGSSRIAGHNASGGDATQSNVAQEIGMAAERMFDVLDEGTFSVVRFRSDIEEASTRAGEVYDDLVQFAGQVECLKLAIDLTGMRYVPSSVLGIFARLSGQGIEVHVVGASSDIVEVLEVTRLNRIMHVNEIDVTSYDTSPVQVEVPPDCTAAALDAYFIRCPSCAVECRIAKHDLGHRFECSGCEHGFAVTAEILGSATHVRARCPKCDHILRVRSTYLRQPIACNHCDQHLEIRAVL
jgi:anti-anti-sigma factor